MSQPNDTPIEKLVQKGSAKILTAAAKKLTKVDLIALGSDLQTPRTISLTSHDVNTIKRAFNADHIATEDAFFGPSDDTSCCCTPCCCATAVVKPVSGIS